MQFIATPQLNAALAQAKPNFEPIVADETAAFSTKNGGRIEFDYADLSDIIPAVTNALSEQGLAITSQITPLEGRLYLVSRLLHASGESIESYYPLSNPDGDPKGFGASLTYGRRYNTLCLLEINTVDDDYSKRKRKEKAANAMRTEVNRQRREEVPKPAAVRSPETAKPTPVPQTPISQQEQEELYPQHNGFFNSFAKAFEFEGIFDFARDTITANWKGRSRPGHLDQESLEVLMSIIVCEWGVEVGLFESFELAQNSLDGRLGVFKAIKEGRYTLGEWRDTVIAWRDERSPSPAKVKELTKV